LVLPPLPVGLSEYVRVKEQRCDRCQRELDDLSYYFPASHAERLGWGKSAVFLCRTCPTPRERRFLFRMLEVGEEEGKRRVLADETAQQSKSRRRR
jgi:hypothetical protein